MCALCALIEIIGEADTTIMHSALCIMHSTKQKVIKMQNLTIHTEFIKLESAMKLANCIETGGMAKAVIQDGLVAVNGEICLMRGKKLYPGDKFSFDGQEYLISIH